MRTLASSIRRRLHGSSQRQLTRSSGRYGIARRPGIAFLLAFALLPLTSIRADIPVPIPTSFSLSKLASFPKYKFFYSLDATTPPTQLVPITDGQTYKAHKNVRLFAQEEGSAAPEEFAMLRHQHRGKGFALEIRGITRDDTPQKVLKVDYGEVVKEPPPFVPHGPVRPRRDQLKAKPTAAAATATDGGSPEALSYFLLAGLSLAVFVSVRQK
jgi:hypothetical protein